MKEQLINIFSNGSVDIKSTEITELLHEAFNRIYNRNQAWRMVKAKEEHICVRGCSIEQKDVFFKFEHENDKFSICSRCMALILYLHGAHNKEDAFKEW